jgi:tyrosinase
MASRTRQSIQTLVDEHSSGNTAPLENLIIAFRKIQALPPSDPDSFESIAGYHGEPFTQKPPTPINDYWGGYCQHNTVLFPTWHRAYVLRLERALQNQGPDPNLAMPFWDECANVDDADPNHPIAPATPIPAIFTSPTLDFEVDGSNANPLYSYTLQQGLVDDEDGTESPSDPNRYTKPKGYKTIRYPMSGLVGNVEDLIVTESHNNNMDKKYPTSEALAGVLNGNVKAWLEGTVKIDTSGGQHNTPDTYSVYSRYVRCLNAPSYSLFSNKATKNAWLSTLGPNVPPETFVALEEPHNAIHLSLGGFYQPATYNADPIRDANGDMGENNTASFDPIFFFHHCFVDYVFWQWQIRAGQTSVESLEVGHETLQENAGWTSSGQPGLPVGTTLDFNTPLAPIQKPNSTDVYTSNDIVDIENQLGYAYGPGSLTQKKHKFLDEPAKPVGKLLHIHGIDRTSVSGSFVVRTYVDNKDGKTVEIGRTEVLSRYNLESCANCQNHLGVGDYIPLHEEVLPLLKGGGQDLDQLNVRVFVQTHGDPVPSGDALPPNLKPAPKLHWTEFKTAAS